MKSAGHSIENLEQSSKKHFPLMVEFLDNLFKGEDFKTQLQFYLKKDINRQQFYEIIPIHFNLEGYELGPVNHLFSEVQIKIEGYLVYDKNVQSPVTRMQIIYEWKHPYRDTGLNSHTCRFYVTDKQVLTFKEYQELIN